MLAEGKIVGGELAVEAPVARLFGRFLAVRTKQRKVDHSWNQSELENMGKDAAIDYLQIPERVKQIEFNKEGLVNKLNKLAEATGDVDCFNDPKHLEEDQRKLVEYTV